MQILPTKEPNLLLIVKKLLFQDMTCSSCMLLTMKSDTQLNPTKVLESSTNHSQLISISQA